MTGPLLKNVYLYPETYLIVALIAGIALGYIWELSGFSNPKMLASQLYFTNFRILKVMFTALVVGMFSLLIFSYVGWLDYERLYIDPVYLGALISGAMILGSGFAIGGYCPDTSLVALATGKIDALFFLIGVFFGAFVFGFFFDELAGWYNAFPMGQLRLNEVWGIPLVLLALLMISVVLVLFWLAEKAKRKGFNPYGVDLEDPHHLGSEVIKEI